MLQITVNEKSVFDTEIKDGQWYINDKGTAWDVRELPGGLISILYNGRSYTAIIENIDYKAKELKLRINNTVHTITVKEPIDQLLTSMGINMQASAKIDSIKAPMPGMVLKVLVQAGQAINKGDGLLILEAMKMENILKSPASATVKSVKINERTAVEKGAILIELE